jgi:hypothetical protein
MTRWHPDRDLARLLEALSEEILAATDEELRQALAEAAGSIARTVSASEVRTLVAAAGEDADDPGAARLQAVAVNGPRPHARPH